MDRRSIAISNETCSYLVAIGTDGFRSDLAPTLLHVADAKMLLDTGIVIRCRALLPASLSLRLREMRMVGVPRAPFNPRSGAKRIALWSFEGRMRLGHDDVPELVVSAIEGLDHVETKDGLLNLLETVDPL